MIAPKNRLKDSFVSSMFTAIVIFVLINAGNVFAQHPYDSYDAPVDSVVAWFYDYCNQNQQTRAFWHITKQKYYYGSPYSMVEINPEYDFSEVRDAFVYFVRSISINKQQTGGCTEFFPDAWLGETGDNSKGEYWEGYTITALVLSLYMNLGYTVDLYQIADSLYRSSEKIPYLAYIWNQLGTGYLQHLESEVQTNPDHLLGIGIAGRYLRYYPTPLETMSSIAVNILHLAAISTSREQRRWATFQLCDVFLKGYQEVRADILLLKNDSDEGVKNGIRGAIRSKQYYKHQMMNFLNDE